MRTGTQARQRRSMGVGEDAAAAEAEPDEIAVELVADQVTRGRDL